MEGGVGGFDFHWVDPDHPAAGTEGDGGESEKFQQKTPEIGNRDALSQGRVGDEQGDAARGATGNLQKIPEIFLNEVGPNSRDPGGPPVADGGLNGGGGEVGAQDRSDSSQAGALDQLEAGTAEGVPNRFVRERAGEPSHGGGEGGVGGGRNVLLAVGEAGVGGEAGSELNPIAGGVGMDLDGPGGLP